MTISLRDGEYGYTSFNDKEVFVYLNNDNFVDWLDMNWDYISQAVEDFGYNDAWCCGGAFEVELDILQIYQNAPYDLEVKYREMHPEVKEESFVLDLQNASRCLKIRSRINFLDLFFLFIWIT